MEVIKSNKGGEKLCLNGYMYVVHKKSLSNIRWKCSKIGSLKCKGSLTTNLDKTEAKVVAEHNHLANDTDIQVAKAVQKMKEVAQNNVTARPLQIYAESVSTLSDTTRSEMPQEETVKRTLRNHKRKNFPKVPLTLQDLNIEGDWSTTGNEANFERFLLHDSGQNSEERVIIFADNASLRLLSSSTAWYMDGNFSLAPPHFTQLYVIRVPVRQFFVTTVYALLERKTQATYEHLLRTLLEECANRDLFPDPITVHLDFEKAAIQALKETLGEEIIIRGCFYHLCQATHRKIQSLGLEATYRENGDLARFCGMLDGLAFLPVVDVRRGMQFLRENTPEGAEELLNYFDQTYVTGTYRRQGNVNNGNIRMRNLPPAFPPTTWNVHDSTLAGEDRTNNQTEGWNHRFSNLVGTKHPSIWLLINKMRQERAVDATKLLQNQAGLQMRKKKTDRISEFTESTTSIV